MPSSTIFLKAKCFKTRSLNGLTLQQKLQNLPDKSKFVRKLIPIDKKFTNIQWYTIIPIVQVIRLNQKEILSLKHNTFSWHILKWYFFFSVFICTTAFPKENRFRVYSKDERNTEGSIK